MDTETTPTKVTSRDAFHWNATSLLEMDEDGCEAYMVLERLFANGQLDYTGIGSPSIAEELLKKDFESFAWRATMSGDIERREAYNQVFPKYLKQIYHG